MKKRKHKKSVYGDWQRILQAGIWPCICGEPATTIDHIIPASLLAALLQEEAIYQDGENMQPMCRLCNAIKGARLDHSNPKTIPLLKKYVAIYESFFHEKVQKTLPRDV